MRGDRARTKTPVVIEDQAEELEDRRRTARVDVLPEEPDADGDGHQGCATVNVGSDRRNAPAWKALWVSSSAATPPANKRRGPRGECVHHAEVEDVARSVR